MRQIKFRGLHYNPQTKQTKWVYGDLVFNRYVNSGMDREGTITIESREDGKMTCYRVPTKSVGQFTELKNKNNKEIYEGDIIKDADGFVCQITFGNGKFYTLYGEKESLKVAEWVDKGNKLKEYEPDMKMWHDTEVIGNIIKNPELLGQKK